MSVALTPTNEIHLKSTAPEGRPDQIKRNVAEQQVAVAAAGIHLQARKPSRAKDCWRRKVRLV